MFDHLSRNLHLSFPPPLYRLSVSVFLLCPPHGPPGSTYLSALIPDTNKSATITNRERSLTCSDPFLIIAIAIISLCRWQRICQAGCNLRRVRAGACKKRGGNLRVLQSLWNCTRFTRLQPSNDECVSTMCPRFCSGLAPLCYVVFGALNGRARRAFEKS